MKPPLKIDVFSDLCCPWCIIGATRLDAALSRLPADAPIDVEFHPFLLDRNTPASGVNVPEMLRIKHGVTDPRTIWARVESEARQSGIPLDLSRQPMAYSSIDGHTVIRAARAKGTQRALHRALIEGYFLGIQNIADHTVLDRIAREHGFGEGEVAALLADPGERQRTLDEADRAIALGIRSVPTFVLGGRRALPSGQSADQLYAIFRQAFNAEAVEA